MVFLIIMGVCGCGKTTVGQALAKELKVPFNDADDFHSSANKRKMNQEIPLTDDDRLPWLVSIHRHMESAVKSGQQGIVACSALKKKYRNILLTGSAAEEAESSIENDVTFIYLRGSASIIRKRMLERRNHYMPVGLLDSQLAILEEPGDKENHLVIDVNDDVESIVKEILDSLHR